MSGNLKCLWEAYTELKIWSGTTQSSGIVQVKESSMDESETGASSKPPAGFATITVLIYPSTEPFRKQGLPIEIHLPYTYPHHPPAVYLKIAMRHPNIDKDGKICSNLLDHSKTYKPMSLPDVVKLIASLLDKPEAGHVVDAETGSLLDSRPAEYNAQITEAVMNQKKR